MIFFKDFATSLWIDFMLYEEDERSNLNLIMPRRGIRGLDACLPRRCNDSVLSSCLHFTSRLHRSAIILRYDITDGRLVALMSQAHRARFSNASQHSCRYTHISVKHCHIRTKAFLSSLLFRSPSCCCRATSRELLYGGLENQDDVLNEEGENGNNSLEDCDLEGVDDILREKGRIGVFEASSAPEREIEGDASRCHGPSITTPNDEGQPARDGQTERVETMKVSNLNARGTGANAANTLKATTAPSLIARVRSPRPFGGAGHQAKAISDEGEESAQMTDVRSRSDGVLNAAISGTALHSPTRRKPTATPFIQAKGLTLTLAQAKLFGLARNINDSSAPIPLATILKAHAGGVACHENGTLLSSREHYERTRRSKGYRRGGRRRNRTYSPSRMEELARPVPGRGRVSNEEICGNEETGPRARSRRRADDPSFTWKRTRRAEAAMRDPACGYDFVREGNGDGRDAFLRRVEAHSLHCRTRLEFQRASDLYDARLDKLECPK